MWSTVLTSLHSCWRAKSTPNVLVRASKKDGLAVDWALDSHSDCLPLSPVSASSSATFFFVSKSESRSLCGWMSLLLLSKTILSVTMSTLLVRLRVVFSLVFTLTECSPSRLSGPVATSTWPLALFLASEREKGSNRHGKTLSWKDGKFWEQNKKWY